MVFTPPRSGHSGRSDDMSAVYYNEIDPFAAAWLRELMQAGQIPDGEIDTRSIADIRPDDLRGFGQCHFFAGIGGWAYALRLAGWGDRAVWTGSCPCQPWSVAGSNAGADDSRDLWPAWVGLIAQCRPAVVFGEQVCSPDALLWIDRAVEDLELLEYAVGACVLPAVSVGTPHRRDRFYVVADAGGRDTAGRDQARRREQSRQKMGVPWAYAHWQGGQSETRGVDDGLSGDVAKRACGGYGNAIVPQLAQVWVEAYLDVVTA